MRTIRPLLLILLLVMPMAVHAQEEALPLAVTYEDKLYVMQTVPNSPPQLLESLTLVSDTPTYNYLASWSPDGTMLAYATSTSGDVPNTLMVWDGEQSIEVLSARFGVEIPFGWTDDGQIVYMQVSGDIGNFLGQVYTVAPEAGAQPTLVAENLPADVMCSIGMLVPMNTQLWREADVLEVAPFLAVTEAGILYGKGCSGSSVSLYRFETGEVISFAEDRLVRAALSPDGSQLAGIDLRSGTLIVVDLASLTETAIPTSEPITRVVWGDDGSLYYTSVTQTGNLVGGLTEEQRQQVLTISQQQNKRQ